MCSCYCRRSRFTSTAALCQPRPAPPRPKKTNKLTNQKQVHRWDHATRPSVMRWGPWSGLIATYLLLFFRLRAACVSLDNLTCQGWVPKRGVTCYVFGQDDFLPMTRLMAPPAFYLFIYFQFFLSFFFVCIVCRLWYFCLFVSFIVLFPSFVFVFAFNNAQDRFATFVENVMTAASQGHNLQTLKVTTFTPLCWSCFVCRVLVRLFVSSFRHRLLRHLKLEVNEYDLPSSWKVDGGSMRNSMKNDQRRKGLTRCAIKRQRRVQYRTKGRINCV